MNSDSPFDDVDRTTYWSLCRRHGKMSYAPLHRKSSIDLFIFVNNCEQFAGQFFFQSTGVFNSKEETELQFGRTAASYKRKGSVGQWMSGGKIIGRNISSLGFRLRLLGTSITETRETERIKISVPFVGPSTYQQNDHIIHANLNGQSIPMFLNRKHGFLTEYIPP